MMTMGSFCSGIGAPEVAARNIAKPLWFSEIEPFPCAVLAHHWPDVPNLGDMTAPDIVDRIKGIGIPDVVVAGLPCQPFSTAGLRRGEADPRNLTVRFVEIANAVDNIRRHAGEPPVVWVIENVPGILSDRNNAFGSLLGAMVGGKSAIVPRGRWKCSGVANGPQRSAAWRILDAKHFGVAQRRRRVFCIFVGDSLRWIGPEALLPIIKSVSWHSPPSREAEQDVAALTSNGVGAGGGADDNAAQANHLIATDLVAFDCKGTEVQHDASGVSPPLRSMGRHQSHQDAGGHAAVAFVENQRGELRTDDISPQLTTGGGKPGQGYPAAMQGPVVRRLMPIECARLQGFSDTHTAITYRGKPATDGPQYKAYGNSMAVPVVRWIMDRIRASHATQEQSA